MAEPTVDPSSGLTLIIKGSKGEDLPATQDLVKSMLASMATEAILPQIGETVKAAVEPLRTEVKGELESVKAELGKKTEEYNAVKASLELAEKRLDAADKILPKGEKFAGAALAGSEERWEAFNKIGEIFVATRNAFCSNGQNIDRNVFKADSSGETNAAGGALVPTDWQPEVARIPLEVSIPMQIFQRINMTTRKRSFPVENLMPAVYWAGTSGDVAEGAAPSNSSYTFQASNAELVARTMIAASKVTSELEEDSVVEFRGFLARMFFESAGLEHNKQAFAGTGAPFTGLKTLSGLGELSQPDGNTQALDVRFEDITGLMAKVPSRLMWRGSFFVNPVAFQNIVNVKDGAGRHMYITSFTHNFQAMPLSQVPDQWRAAPALLMGRPVYFTDVLPANPDPDEAWLIYGDPMFAFYGDLKAITIDWSPHPYFLNNALAIRLTQRCVPGFFPIPSAFARLKTAAA